MMKVGIRKFNFKKYFKFMVGSLAVFGAIFPLVGIACWLLGIPWVYAYKVSSIVTLLLTVDIF